MLNTISSIVISSLQRPSVFSLAFILSAYSASVSADDTEIYDIISNVPKVLFVLDASGSMSEDDGGDTTRMERMKEALELLINSISDVDVGLMEFSGRNVELIHPVVDVTANRSELIEAAKGLSTGGATPTLTAMLSAREYFRGAQSPTTNECETNHVVLLTDGVPTIVDSGLEDLKITLGGCVDEKDDDGEDRPAATCGTELALHMAKTDQLQHVSDDNFITTHTIGFNLVDNWVERVAGAGDGTYHDAASAQDLLIAFESILEEVQLTATASTPTVSANAFSETRHRDELFYSFFQPSRRPRWDGNVKKYRLLDGQIVDADENPVLLGGLISPTSRSLWSDVDDGGNVGDGGLAGRQPADRRWYTDFGLTPAVNGQTTPLLVTDNTDLPLASVGAATDNERDVILDWVRGADSIDVDNDGDMEEPNRYVADGLHNSPVLVSYSGKESEDVLNEVVYSATNMGVLHAVDAESGAELWSYSPAELLPNIKQYIENTSESHVYGLDGALTLHAKNKIHTTFDFELDTAWLYLTQRRGGKNIFALDVSNAMDESDPFKVMWKINGGVPGTDFRDLGETWSTPQIIPVRYGCPDACATREVLLFGGGYNPLYDDTDLVYPVTPAPTGHGNAIYMVDPESGELIWSAGNGAHHSLNLSMNDSVPTTPVPVDTDADGVVNVLFFPDVAGHVWRVDLDQNPGLAGDLAIGGGMVADLNAAGQRLRFFNKVDVVISGTTFGTARFNLVLGTGMRSSPLFEEADQNRVFSIRDPWVFTNPVSEDEASGEMLPDYQYVVESDGRRDVITPGDLWDYDLNDTTRSRQFGYFKRFERGVKVLQPTLTHGGRVFLTAYAPPTDSSSCEYLLGESRLYVLDAYVGDNLLPANFGPYISIGSGIRGVGQIVDTGGSEGLQFVSGLRSDSLGDLTAPDNPDVFRRFYRTGWAERDE